jgi:hypothetical protein
MYKDHAWLNPVIDQVTGEHQAAARILIDPGHSADDLRVAPALPAPQYGVNVYSTPSVCTYNIVVPKGTTQLLYTCPDPTVAFLSYQEPFDYAQAFPTSHTAAVDNVVPARYFTKRGYMGVRCTAKSLTVENSTPALSRGGYSLARRLAPKYVTTNKSFVHSTTSLETAAWKNTRMMAEVPLNMSQFTAGSSYEKFDENGCYLVASMVREEYDMEDCVSKTLDHWYDENAPGSSSTNCGLQLSSPNTVMGSADTGLGFTTATEWAPNTVAYENQNGTVFTSGMSDGMSVLCCALIAPSEYNQTYTIKFHARYEYIVDPASPDFVKSMPVSPRMDDFSKLMILAAEMPGMYPASYNGLGKVWNAFKKGLAWVNTTLVKPTLSAAIGGFKNAAIGALQK